MAKSDKLYKNSPRLERDEDGEVGVKKPDEATEENMGDAGNPLPGTPGSMPVNVHQASERHELHHRHVQEHLALHRRHETEHMSGDTDKSQIHKKHESEHKEMQDRHHEELKSMHKRHNMVEPKKEEK